MADKCRPVKLDEVIVVKTKGDPTKHLKKKSHTYTYENSEVYPNGSGKDPYGSINIDISWKCTECGRIVVQGMDIHAPRKCKSAIEVENEAKL